jgi:hypothetical protein
MKDEKLKIVELNVMLAREFGRDSKLRISSFMNLLTVLHFATEAAIL